MRTEQRNVTNGTKIIMPCVIPLLDRCDVTTVELHAQYSCLLCLVVLITNSYSVLESAMLV